MSKPAHNDVQRLTGKDNANKCLDRPVFVTGLPRSGATLVAGLLARRGLWSGSTAGPGPDNNPKGSYEHIGLRKHLITALLKSLKCDPHGVKKLPPFPPNFKLDGLRKAAHALLAADDYVGETRWLYKDARLSLLWPALVSAFPRADWIIVRRPLADVVQSCLKNRSMRNHSNDPASWVELARAYLLHLESLRDYSDHVHELSVDDLIIGNTQAFDAVCQALSLDPAPPTE